MQEPTHGRCKPCGLLYAWNAKKGRRLRDASCPECGRQLSRTAAALLAKATTRKASREPAFRASDR